MWKSFEIVRIVCANVKDFNAYPVDTWYYHFVRDLWCQIKPTFHMKKVVGFLFHLIDTCRHSFDINFCVHERKKWERTVHIILFNTFEKALWLTMNSYQRKTDSWRFKYSDVYILCGQLFTILYTYRKEILCANFVCFAWWWWWSCWVNPLYLFIVPYAILTMLHFPIL